MTVDDRKPSYSGGRLPNAHGLAALLLTESLIHGLISRSIITTNAAIDIVEAAASVQLDIVDAANDASATMWEALALLTAIRDSLRIDVEHRPSEA